MPPTYVTQTLEELDKNMNLEYGSLIRRNRWGVTAYWLAIPLIILVAFANAGLIEGIKRRGPFNPLLLCPSILQLAGPVTFTLFIYLQISSLDLQISENDQMIKETAKLINGCVDAYTSIDMRSNFDESSELQKHTGWITIFALVTLILVSLVVFFQLLAILIVYNCTDVDDDQEPRPEKAAEE